jgi:RimJ/RimL family protein N-acetyltransferase
VSLAQGPTLQTERLLLRRWRAADAEPFARINADPQVMEYFPATLSRAESDELVARIERSFDEHGYGLWAVEVPGLLPFAGFVGLIAQRDPTYHFAPAVEVGWRLAREAWGRGIASEAAAASLEFAFDQLGVEEIVSFTTAGNERSQAVMKRLGMHRDPTEDFLHPSIDPADPLAPHVLYRIGASDWRDGRGRQTDT